MFIYQLQEILDKHNRFPASASHAFRNGYLNRPIIDEWIIILSQISKKIWPGIKSQKHEFRMELSHDVDFPAYYSFVSFRKLIKRVISRAVKKKDLKSFISGPFIYLFFKILIFFYFEKS